MKMTLNNSTVAWPAAKPGAIALGARSGTFQAFQTRHGLFLPAVPTESIPSITGMASTKDTHDHI